MAGLAWSLAAALKPASRPASNPALNPSTKLSGLKAGWAGTGAGWLPRVAGADLSPKAKGGVAVDRVAGAAGVPKPLKAGWAGDLSPKPKVGVHVAGAGSPAGLGPKANEGVQRGLVEVGAGSGAGVGAGPGLLALSSRHFVMLALPWVGVLGDLRRLGVVHRWSGTGAVVETSGFFGSQSWNDPRYQYVAVQNVFVRTFHSISFCQIDAFFEKFPLYFVAVQ